MTVHNVENKSLHLGDNIYQAGAISVPAQTSYKAGMLLKRSGDGFAAAAAADTAIAVLGFAVENTAAAAVTKNASGIIWGRVRRDMLFYNAAPATALTTAQCDALRVYGIVVQDVTDLSALDNQ